MIKLHGAPERFEVVADFVYSRFGKSIKYIADVAGGQAMLAEFIEYFDKHDIKWERRV